MTPESFNAQLAIRKLEAADILLIQAKTGSDADRIRAASAILRIAFMTEPKPQKAAPQQPIAKDAPARPERSEDVPGDPPDASTSPLHQVSSKPPSAVLPAPSRSTADQVLVNSS